MNVHLDDLVQAYLAIRTSRDTLKKEYETQDEEMKKDMAQIEQVMLGMCTELGNINSINTPFGTVIRSLKERFNCGDWDNFNKFVLEQKAVDLYEKRIHQGNMKTFFAAHPDAGLPPGVSVFREFDITVRKPTN